MKRIQLQRQLLNRTSQLAVNFSTSQRLNILNFSNVFCILTSLYQPETTAIPAMLLFILNA